MTVDLLLDAHILLWLANRDQRLRPSTRDLIDGCRANGGTILLSAVTAWEIAQLVFLDRILLDLPVDASIERCADEPGVKVVPLNYRAAARAYRLNALESRDPSHRLLIATAVERSCPLITYDARIVQFGKKHGDDYGFRAWS